MNWYYPGFPYSDELYHHGIKGQKWGTRRYQNEDGTLTALGKMRYGVSTVGKTFAKGVSNAGSAVGKGVKRVGGALSNAYKKRHPHSMNDSELQDAIKRLEMEKKYSDLKASLSTSTNRGKRVVTDLLESGARTLSNRAFNELANTLFDKKEKKDMTLPSNQLVETFKEEWKGGNNKWSRQEVEEFGNYLDALRKIEGQNSGNKKNNKKK